ncbi:autotransporter domain-containing protein [Parapedomonas caeni]
MRKFPALATLNRSASVVALAAGLASLAGTAQAVPTVFFNEDLVAGETTFVNAITAADAAYNLANNDTQTSNIFTYDIMNNTGASFTVTSGAETVYVRTSQSQNAGFMNSVDGDEQSDGFTGWGNSHDGTWAGAVALGYTVEFFADAGYTTPYLMNAVGLYVTNWGTCCTLNNPTPDGGTVNASEVYMLFNGGTPLLVGGISTSIAGEEHFVAAIDDRNSFSSVTLIANGRGEYFGAGAYLTFSTVQLNSVPAGLSVVTVGDTTPDIDTDQEAYTTDELANSEVNPTFAGGTLLVTSSQEIGNGFTVGGAGGTVDTDGFDLTLTGVIDGGGQFTKTGAGTLVLTGANTYSGGTRIEEGDIEIDDASSLGSGDITFAGGTLTLGQGAGDGVTLNQGLVVEATNGTLDTSGGDVTIGGGLGGTGILSIVGGNDVALTSVATGAINLTAGTLTIVTEAGGDATGPIGLSGGTLTTDGDYTFTGALNVTSGTLDTSGGNLTLGGGLGGTGILSIVGGNDVALTSVATGAINLTAGTLTIVTEAGGDATGPIGLSGGTLTTDGDYTFTGALTFNGGAIDTGASTVTLTGGASGPSCLLKQGSGRLVLAADASNDIGACVEEGTLSQNAVFTGNVWVYEPGTLRGTGLIGGNVEVAGRFAPGNSPGTMTVDGDVAMLASGTLQIDIDGLGTGTGAGNYSRVLASGTFTADGSIEPLLRGITGDANNDFTPEVGDTFIVVAADGGVEGSFDTLVQPDEGLADGTRFDIFYNANTIVLAITPESFANVAGLKGNAGAVATTIDGLRDDDAGASLRFNLAGLDTGGLRTSMQQLGGEIHADLLAAGLEGRRLARGAVGQHLANLRSGRKSVTPISDATREATGSRKAGDAAAMVENVEPGEVLWVQGIGRTGHVSGDAMAFGYKYDVAGVAAGLDVALGGGWRLGAGLAAISGDVDARSMDLGHGNAKSTQLFAYASWAQSGYFVDAVVAYGSDRYTTSRSVVLADGAVANDSSAKGHSWAADLSAGARLSLGSLTVEPTAGLRWDRGNRKALTEGGSAVTGLTFDKETLTALQGKAGVRAQHVYALKSVAITAEARAFWLHDFNKANDMLTPVLAGASLGVVSANPGRDAASLGAGLSIDTTENVDLYVDYDAQLRKGETAHAVIGGLRVRF